MESRSSRWLYTLNEQAHSGTRDGTFVSLIDNLLRTGSNLVEEKISDVPF